VVASSAAVAKHDVDVQVQRFNAADGPAGTAPAPAADSNRP